MNKPDCICCLNELMMTQKNTRNRQLQKEKYTKLTRFVHGDLKQLTTRLIYIVNDRGERFLIKIYDNIYKITDYTKN